MVKFITIKLRGYIQKVLMGACLLTFMQLATAQQTITQWLNTAQQRIDTLRKGDFTIKVLDASNNSITDSVIIQLKRHEFVFGCANDFSTSNYSSDPKLPSVNDWLKAGMLKYFNLNVTGNAYKWSGVQPYNATSHNYVIVDSMVNWDQKSGMNNIKGHNLIWGAYNDSDYHSIPKWVIDLPSNQAIYDACETRVRSMVSHYKGKFKEIDVLNEPLHATWLKTKLGSDSIYWNLFKWAKQEDPSVKLYINDYNVEYNWGDANSYKALIKKMISKGAPVEGIGVQAHFWSGDINLAELKQNMDTLATLGIPMKFTEFDLASMSQLNQAKNTAAAFRFAFSHPAFNGIISWAFWDVGAWRDNSGYFDALKAPKLALDTVYNLLNKIWTTKVKGQLTTSGISFKGYYGQYEVKVKFGNTWKQFIVDCDKLHNDSVLVINESAGKAITPHFVSAKLISRNQVLVKFDKKMNSPASFIRAFKLFQGNALKIDSISLFPGDSSSLYIKLASNANNNYISVFYSNGSITSKDGGLLEPFGPEKVENNYVALQSAITSTNGKSIEGKFNKAMVNPSSQVNAFKVFINGVSAGIDSLRLKSGNDSVFIFYPSKAIMGGDVVTLSYTPGTVTSKDNRDLYSFTGFAVENVVPNFLIISAKTTLDGKKVLAKFNMKASNTNLAATDFIVLINSIASGIDSARLSTENDSTVILYITSEVKLSNTVLLSYTAGSYTSQDGFKLLSFSNFSVTNTVQALSISISYTSNDGKIVYAHCNKPMLDPSAQLSTFKIYVNSSSVTLDSVRLKAGNDSIIVVYLNKAVVSSNVVLFFYYPGTVSSVGGEKLALTRFFPVENLTLASSREDILSDSFKLYPNPAKDNVLLSGDKKIKSVVVYNTLGNVVKQVDINDNLATIEISELPSGTYCIKIIPSKGETIISKFIKTE